MHDPTKLPVEMWAEIKDGRTRLMVSVNGAAPFEMFSWPSNAAIVDGRITS